MPLTGPVHCLTPEEESIGDLEDEGDIDDTLPSDLWFETVTRHSRCPRRQDRTAGTSGLNGSVT